jgi:short subunit fatty acids transporter
VRLRSESRWLPAEWVFGLLLLLVAAGVAALVLTGTVHVGHLH